MAPFYVHNQSVVGKNGAHVARFKELLHLILPYNSLKTIIRDVWNPLSLLTHFCVVYMQGKRYGT